MADFGQRADPAGGRDWILSCEGMTVDAPDGVVGHVVEPLYGHSARWDRPWALAVRGEGRVFTVPLEAVEVVDSGGRRIRIDRPSADLAAG